MKINLIDYKGKYFTWQDEDLLTPEDLVIAELDTSSLTDEAVYTHVDSCVYYGIPAYTGVDTELNNRVADAYNKINELDASDNVCLSCEA